MAWAAGQGNNVIQLSRRPLSGPQWQPSGGAAGSGGSGRNVTVQINKIADNVTVRSDSDMDEIAERTAKKIIEELDNTA